MLDVRLAEGAGGEASVAAAEVDDAERLLKFAYPFGQRDDDLFVAHVVVLHDGIVHGPLLEDFFDAGDGGSGHEYISIPTERQ